MKDQQRYIRMKNEIRRRFWLGETENATIEKMANEYMVNGNHDRRMAYELAREDVDGWKAEVSGDRTN